jgi:hypothetical protein
MMSFATRNLHHLQTIDWQVVNSSAENLAHEHIQSSSVFTQAEFDHRKRRRDWRVAGMQHRNHNVATDICVNLSVNVNIHSFPYNRRCIHADHRCDIDQ